MNIDREELLSAALRIGIPENQAINLWNHLYNEPSKTNKFDLPHIFYNIGALIVISAMTWFLGTGWEKFGGQGILTISVAYIAIFVTIGAYLWNRTSFKTPGGLFITLAVCMIPLAIYGFQRYTGWWLLKEPGNYQDFYHWVKGGWFFMELGTVAGSLIALWYFRFAFLTAPLFFVLWFMSMDITPLLFGENFPFDLYMKVSLYFGLILLITAYFIDQRTQQDFAFWGYFFGMLAFWGGLSLLNSHSEAERFAYFLINFTLIVLSVLLQRIIFLIFGTIGVFGYIASLFFRYFHESTFFPFVLSVIGIIVIFLGIMYSKKKEQIEKTILESLPKFIIKLLPQSRHNMK